MTKWIILAALVLAAPAFAQPMNCGTRLIEPGNSMAMVLEFCGRPDNQREWTEVIPGSDDDEGMETATRIPMAEWLYDDDDDPDQFPSKVFFRNGMVTEIRN